MSKLPFPWIQEPWSVEGRSFWVLIRGGRGRIHHLPTSEEKVCVTEAGFNRQGNYLQQTYVRIFICKIQMFWFLHLSRQNCSIMYKHPHICLYTGFLQTKRRGAFWTRGKLSQVCTPRTAGLWPMLVPYLPTGHPVHSAAGLCWYWLELLLWTELLRKAESSIK